MSFAAALPDRYRVILCDIWGVVHDGVMLYPGAGDRLQQWREEGRSVILVTNAPRTAEAVHTQLDRLGLQREAWDAICTSGEAGIVALLELDRPVGFLGTPDDRAILEGRGVRIADDEEFTDLACTGFPERTRDIGPYLPPLHGWADRGITLHCLNPDRVVMRGGVLEACAGALADEYEAIGGQVAWYGKPHPAIYRHALRLAGNPDAGSVLAVGDSLATDVLGAARNGFDCLFVTGGIHEGEPFPRDFGQKNGLGDWQPVAVVASLE